jgi:phage baseplate assembly protein V
MSFSDMYTAVKRATLLSVDDTETFRVGTFSYGDDQTLEAEIFSCYGDDFNPPVGATATLFTVNGSEENLFALVDDHLNRQKNLLPGEKFIHSPASKSYTHYKQDGDVSYKVTKDIILEVDNNATITIKGDATINCLGTLNVVCPNVNITGSATITGDLTVVGALTNNSVNVGSTHTHSGTQPGVGNTGVPN